MRFHVPLELPRLHQWHREPDLRLWLYLATVAASSSTGSALVTYRELVAATAFQHGRTRVEFTRKQLRGALERLESAGDIGRDKGHAMGTGSIAVTVDGIGGCAPPMRGMGTDNGHPPSSTSRDSDSAIARRAASAECGQPEENPLRLALPPAPLPSRPAGPVPGPGALEPVEPDRSSRSEREGNEATARIHLMANDAEGRAGQESRQGTGAGHGAGRDSDDWDRALELFDRLNLRHDQIRTLHRMRVSDRTLHVAARECWEDRREVRNYGGWIYKFAQRIG